MLEELAGVGIGCQAEVNVHGKRGWFAYKQSSNTDRQRSVYTATLFALVSLRCGLLLIIVIAVTAIAVAAVHHLLPANTYVRQSSQPKGRIVLEQRQQKRCLPQQSSIARHSPHHPKSIGYRRQSHPV